MLVLAVALVALLVVVIFLWAPWRAEKSGLVALHPMKINTDAADQATLDQLRTAGSNLAKPTEIRHYLYVPNQKVANLAAKDLSSQGYTVTVETSADPQPGQEWLDLATRTVLPRMEYLRASRASFAALAAKYGGVYDGWEAAVSK